MWTLSSRGGGRAIKKYIFYGFPFNHRISENCLFNAMNITHIGMVSLEGEGRDTEERRDSLEGERGSGLETEGRRHLEGGCHFSFKKYFQCMSNMLCTILKYHLFKIRHSIWGTLYYVKSNTKNYYEMRVQSKPKLLFINSINFKVHFLVESKIFLNYVDFCLDDMSLSNDKKARVN